MAFIDANLARVKLYLTQHHIPFEVIEHSEVKTMQDVIKVLDANPAAMIKAALVKIKSAIPHFALLGIPALSKVNFHVLAATLSVGKNKLVFANQTELLRITGFNPGALPPFSLQRSLPFFIDSSINEHEYIFCGAGTHFHTLKIKFVDFIKLPGYQNLAAEKKDVITQ